MEKSAISLLQEIAIKHGYVPTYIEGCSETSDHVKVFSYTVKCKNFSATGTGLRKKQAKHCAALAMLRVLVDAGEILEKILENVKVDVSGETNLEDQDDESNLNVQAIDTSLASKLSGTVIDSSAAKHGLLLTVNFVGKLQEYCQNMQISMPIYDTVSKEGFAHTPIFTTSCTIGDISAEAFANTKKGSKQLAAKKVLQKLKPSKNDLQNHPYKKQNISEENVEASLQSLNVQFRNAKIQEIDVEDRDKILSYYKDLKSNISNMNHTQINIDYKIINYHLIHQALCSRISALHKKQLYQATHEFGQESIHYYKNLINAAFNLDIETVSIPSKITANNFIIGLRLPTVPVLFEIGIGITRQNAEQQAYFKLLKLINDYILL